MNVHQRTMNSLVFKMMAITMLLFSLVVNPIATPIIYAQGGETEGNKDGHGSINNEEKEVDHERATINKQVNFGNKSGEYFIDLTVKGKDNTKIDTMDIVLAYDLSNSMERQNVPGTGLTRTKVAHDATVDFVKDLLDDNNNYRIAFVPYGTAVMDGKTPSYLQNNISGGGPTPEGGNYRQTASGQAIPFNYYHGEFTSNSLDITSKIPEKFTDENGDDHGNHGATFTQQAIERAGEIIKTSDADHRVIVTITDGLPTVSYNKDRVVWGSGNEGQANEYMEMHINSTVSEADQLKDDYRLYSVGIGLNPDNERAKRVVEGIAGTSEDSYFADSIEELTDALNEITRKMSNSVVDGSIEDPITEEFIIQSGNSFTKASSKDLTDGEYFLSASDDGLLEGVVAKVEGKNLIVDGLNLGEEDEVTIRYKVQVDTDNLEINPDQLYPTNGNATLTPVGDNPGETVSFPVPEASTVPTEVSGEKTWVDYGYEEHRPDHLTVKLYRQIKGEERLVKEVKVTPNKDGEWKYVFDDVFLYDTNGEKINYTIKEEVPTHYEPETDGTNITNILQQEPEIELEKVGVSTSELGENVIEEGKDIEYSFTITNTGNLPLEDISLTDDLPGMTDFTYETLNGEAFTGDIKDLVMNPGDVLLATASYTVTQKDVDYGVVENEAEVTGIPTVPEPDENFDDTPVKDEDNAITPGELEPAISLKKTADKEKVSEVGEEIEYTFEIKNTGNMTLTEVSLNDPMLGGKISLDVDTLKPGESTTARASYEVTQEDINNGEIVNKAEVEGTPPPAYTENPDNPDKVTDEDDEKVKADQEPEISLIKEADIDELTEGETITYTFTATNTGNTTLTKVEITDLLDGISAIDYLTVNDNSNFDRDNIVLEPDDVLVAEATYTVTQEDVVMGQVYNEATVTGLDPKEEEVTDKDHTAVPGEVELGIELEKTSDKHYVTEAGQEIEYSFTVTNTSNVSLIDVIVNDPMLGGEIEVIDFLAPNRSAEVSKTYTVTEKDLEADVIENIATATGTPPNPNDEPPTSPETKDKVSVAKIELEKTVLPEIYTEVGQELTYTLVVTNTGDVTINDVTLTDDMFGGDIKLEVDTLAPGESTKVEIPYTVTEADVEAGEILNTAKTEGTPEGYDPEDPNTPGKVSDEDDAEAKYAALELEKTSDKEKVEKAGDEITYTFEVTNVGQTILEDIVINDEMLAELDIEVELEETTLEPGESTTGTATYTVTQEDIDKGGVYNVATTTGTSPGYDPEDPRFPDEPPVSPPSEEYVPSDQNPEIELVKSTETEEYTKVGQEIEYVFTVTNTGNVTLSDVKVDDETLKVEVALAETTLAPGESTTGTYTHIVTQDDLDNSDIHNFANTEGTPPPVIDPEDPDNPVEQDPVTDEDDEAVSGKQDASIALVKEADKQEVERAGDEITYTLTATNTGNVTLTDVTVTDEMLGGELEVSPSTLAPGEEGIVTGTYTVTQDDIDRHEEIVNIATATGTPPGYDPEDPPTDPEDPNYPPVTPPVEEKVPVVEDTEITLVKQADKEKLVEGETITYTFTATNTGNTTLEKVNLVDELEGISEINYLTVNDEVIEDVGNITLTPGDVLVAEATYKVTQEDVDANEVYNEAVVEGTPPAKENPEDPDNPIEQDPVTDDDETKVPSEHKPEISLEKSTEKQEVADAGEVITYKFVVTNRGNVTLEDVRVDDPMLQEAGIDVDLEKTKLVPGESTVGYADYKVTQDDLDNHEKIVNIATATGTPPGEDPEDPVSPPSEAEVPVIEDPALSIEKTAEEEVVTEAGDTITYNFVVTNTGNQTLDDVRVIDEMLENAGVKVELEKTTLAPDESTNGSAVYTVTQADIDSGLVENIATATGTPPGKDPEDPNNPVSPPSEEEVPTERNPDISLDKTSDTIRVTEAGQTVTYKFVVTNTGNVTLEDLVINDPMLGGDIEVGVAALAPGESATVKQDYVVTEEDLTNEVLENIATVTGTPLGYDPNDPNSLEKPVDEDEEIINIDQSTPGKVLPKTATQMYSLIALGVSLLGLGIFVLVSRKRKEV